MVITNVSDAKRDFSALVEKVAHGETVLVLRRGRPIARIVPTNQGALEPHDRLLLLERSGLLAAGLEPPDASILDQDPPSADTSVLDALIDERRGGR
jgi:prevent-host-death family protein